MTTPQQWLEQLAAAERAGPSPPPEVGDRVWALVEARLANGPAPPELDSGPLLEPSSVAEVGSAATAKAGASASVVLKIVAAVALVGVVGGGLAVVLREPDPAGPELAAGLAEDPALAGEPESEPEAEPEAEPEPEPEPTPAPELAPEPEPTPEPESTPTPKPKSDPKPKPVAKTLADEVALMQALSTALKRGDSRKVLSLVAEHERDFGEGQFIEERRAAKARGLCQSGELAAGRKQAASFAAAWPKSIHLAAVHQDCEVD
jgi:outer membrane biosynthesis protein TonB